MTIDITDFDETIDAVDETINETEDEAPNSGAGSVRSPERSQESAGDAVSQQLGAGFVQTSALRDQESERPKTLSKGQKARKRRDDFLKKEREEEALREKAVVAEMERKQLEEKMLEEREDKEERRGDESSRGWRNQDSEGEQNERGSVENGKRREEKINSLREPLELAKRLIEVNFKKNEMLNAVEAYPFYPCSKGEAEMIRKNQLVQLGEDPCKLKEACESCAEIENKR